MSDYIFLFAALIGGIRAITFAVWLKKQGNLAGAAAVAGITAAGVGMPIYRMFANF